MTRLAARIRKVPLALALLLSGIAAGAAAAQDAIVGDWQGTLEIPGATLPLIFHITQTDDGLTATLDSPAQGSSGIPVSRVVFEPPRIGLEVAAVNGGYAGELDGDTITGTWSQNGGELALTLERASGAAAMPNRPQEPQAPFPYRVEEVRIAGSEPDVTLAGTLTAPQGEGPFPAVVLISGSGPQDRDESLMGHRPFLVLADHLSRRGVAVLRLDDRGVGASTGSFAAATLVEFADDTQSAVRFLDERADIGPIGPIGHSEGGLVAPLVANRSSRVRFVVLLAGPGMTGKELLPLQNDVVIRAMGGSAEAAAANREIQVALITVLESVNDPEAARVRMREILVDALTRPGGRTADELEPQIQAQLAQLTGAGLRYFLNYDPLPALRTLDRPVLAVNGERDTQVPPRENLDAIRRALTSGNTDDFEVVELPGLNHLFQTARTGAPTEYGTIEETMSPVALEMITTWILARVDTATP